MVPRMLLVAALLSVALPAAAHEPGQGFGGLHGGLTDAERTRVTEERFAEADADADGQLTQEELFAAAEAAERQRREARIASMIEARDADGDGSLSLEEMQQPRDGMGGPRSRWHDGGRHHR